MPSCRALTQRLFLTFSELQVRVDGVFMRPHRLDAIDAAVRESRFRNGVCATQARLFVAACKVAL